MKFSAMTVQFSSLRSTVTLIVLFCVLTIGNLLGEDNSGKMSIYIKYNFLNGGELESSSYTGSSEENSINEKLEQDSPAFAYGALIELKGPVYLDVNYTNFTQKCIEEYSYVSYQHVLERQCIQALVKFKNDLHGSKASFIGIGANFNETDYILKSMRRNSNFGEIGRTTKKTFVNPVLSVGLTQKLRGIFGKEGYLTLTGELMPINIQEMKIYNEKFTFKYSIINLGLGIGVYL